MSSLNVSVGGITLPISANSVATTKAFGDPGKIALLELLAQAITSELELAWATVALGTPLATRTPVEDKYPEKPTAALLLQRKSKLPALYLDRDEEAEEERWAFSSRHKRQQWLLHYVFGEMDPAMGRKFSALMCPIVSVIVGETIRRGKHPGYSSGAVILGGTAASGLISGAYKQASTMSVVGEGTTAPLVGVAVRFETLENYASTVTAVPFDKVLADYDLVPGGVDASGANVEDFLQTDTTAAP